MNSSELIPTYPIPFPARKKSIILTSCFELDKLSAFRRPQTTLHRIISFRILPAKKKDQQRLTPHPANPNFC